MTIVKTTAIALALTVAAFNAHAEGMKPFILGYKTTGSLETVVEDVKAKLSAAKFEIVGSYTPYAGATIIAITNDTLKNAAAKTEFGAYGAGERVTVTQVGEEIQVSYNNPSYLDAAYRMDAPAELASVSKTLEGALGKAEEYGVETPLTSAKLDKFNYMVGMEKFDDPSDLASYANYDEAIAAVEKSLAEHAGGASKVYRIDIPGKKQTVFGVGLAKYNDQTCQSDAFIMSEIDFKPIRSTGHLPYEIVVTEGEVQALYARFRIAINYPELKMVGKNSFLNIMCAPEAIEKALEAAAGNKGA